MTAQTCPPCTTNVLKATNIDSLPDEIIFEILVRVPAQDLYDSTRFVCRKWYNIMYTSNFAQSHLQLSNPGLLVVYMCLREQFFMMMQNGRIEIFKCSYGSDRVVLSSCNGLLLEESRVNWKEMYITNPVTKQQFALPLLKLNTLPNRYALAYAASSRAYKAVGIPCFYDENRDLGLSIMTVGVDTDWERRVSTQHLSLKAKKLLKEFPLTTRGFVHWVQNNFTEYVLTMNVESEIITQIPGPCLRHDGKSIVVGWVGDETGNWRMDNNAQHRLGTSKGAQTFVIRIQTTWMVVTRWLVEFSRGVILRNLLPRWNFCCLQCSHTRNRLVRSARVHAGATRFQASLVSGPQEQPRVVGLMLFMAFFDVFSIDS
ncbi:hypothetical protein CASFOL_023665 [Castilleja foliolosa]|uniref:F-box domain-containing protein n=1 Tax=Castilleja foliolosa TaxID=1961234 RepID=A0ABD3CL66_9LAMI